jgi:hypothetical protein
MQRECTTKALSRGEVDSNHYKVILGCVLVYGMCNWENGEKMMNAKLNREFVFVHQNRGDDKIGTSVYTNLMSANEHNHCVVTDYEDTISISCHGLHGMANLIQICKQDVKEGASMRFLNAMSRKLVEFIG